MQTKEKLVEEKKLAATMAPLAVSSRGSTPISILLAKRDEMATPLEILADENKMIDELLQIEAEP